MTQTPTHETRSAVPLPDVFSEALTGIFEQAQLAIVQVSTEGRGGGTGIIWQRDGRIITNNHVVPRDDARVRVALADGRTFDARVLQHNPQLDLALLKIQGGDLRALPIGDSSTLRVGEWVFAIGHPWGARWVVTAGIVSSISSVKLADNLTLKYIKSDVGLAPGNSGGPLLNANGQVIGINAMIFGGDLSVSIPSNAVSTWLSSLPQGYRKLGTGLYPVELPAVLKQRLQRETGLMIVNIQPERQALYSDLLIGDILLEVAGKVVVDVPALRQVLATLGERVSVKLVRGGKILTLEVATIIAED